MPQQKALAGLVTHTPCVILAAPQKALTRLLRKAGKQAEKHALLHQCQMLVTAAFHADAKGRAPLTDSTTALVAVRLTAA